jgi:DNA-binding LacI/PurR family transcriptional regulator
MNQYMAIGCLAALKELRLRVPEDIAVVGYDDLIWTKHLQPALSTVSQQIEEIGRLAAERLIYRLNYGEEPVTATSITVDTKLIIRASSDRHRELNSQ